MSIYHRPTIEDVADHMDRVDSSMARARKALVEALSGLSDEFSEHILDELADTLEDAVGLLVRASQDARYIQGVAVASVGQTRSVDEI